MQDRAVMTISQGAGGRRFVGALMAMIAGAGLILAWGQDAGSLGAALLALPLLLGLLLIGYRSGVTLERGAGQLIRWRGLFWPQWRRSQPLAGLHHVSLGRERRGSGRNARTLFPVQLRGSASSRLELKAPEDALAGRQLAESVARFLDLELHDDSGGERVIRQPAHLDESLRERYRRQRQSTRMPRQASDAVARHDALRDGTQRIVIPAVGLQPAHAGLLLPVLLFVLFFLPFRLSEPEGQALLGLFLAATGLLVLHLARYREVIDIDAGGLSLRAGGLWPSHSRMAASDIEEVLAPAGLPHFARELAEVQKLADGLDLAQMASGLDKLTRPYAALGATAQVLLRGDRGSLGLGRHLPAAEKPWLRDALIHLLVSQSGPADAPLTRYGSRRRHKGRGLWLLAAGLILLSAAWEAGWLAVLLARLPSLSP